MLSPGYSLLVLWPELLLSFPSDFQLHVSRNCMLCLKSFPPQTKEVLRTSYGFKGIFGFTAILDLHILFYRRGFYLRIFIVLLNTTILRSCSVSIRFYSDMVKSLHCDHGINAISVGSVWQFNWVGTNWGWCFSYLHWIPWSFSISL